MIVGPLPALEVALSVWTDLLFLAVLSSVGSTEVGTGRPRPTPPAPAEDPSRSGFAWLRVSWSPTFARAEEGSRAAVILAQGVPRADHKHDGDPEKAEVNPADGFTWESPRRAVDNISEH